MKKLLPPNEELAEMSLDLSEDVRVDFDEYDDYWDSAPTGWAESSKGVFTPSPPVRMPIPPGFYENKQDDSGKIYFSNISFKVQNILHFPDSNTSKVLDNIRKFWSAEVKEKFAKYRLPYRRGIIMSGPPGTGKTCLIKIVIADLIRSGGVCIEFSDPHMFEKAIRAFRVLHPETPVICLMEDFEAIMQSYNRSQVLNLLDGVIKMDNIIFIATTNYPENLDDGVINRPSRFDLHVKIGFPSKSTRELYFRRVILKEDLHKVDIPKWVKDTNGLSVAHLKELVVSVLILGTPYSEVISRLSSMRKGVDDSSEAVDSDSPTPLSRNKSNKKVKAKLASIKSRKK